LDDVESCVDLDGIGQRVGIDLRTSLDQLPQAVQISILDLLHQRREGVLLRLVHDRGNWRRLRRRTSNGRHLRQRRHGRFLGLLLDFFGFHSLEATRCTRRLQLRSGLLLLELRTLILGRPRRIRQGCRFPRIV
jgi:hypothetical protein